MRILIADRSAATRSALCFLIGEEPTLQVSGEAGDRQQLLAELTTDPPDLVLLDWGLAGNPVATLLPDSPVLLEKPGVIVMSGRPEAEAVALSSGAEAFFSKGDPPDCLLALIRTLQPEDQP